MTGSIFARASHALSASVEIGIGSLERIGRGGLSRQSVREIEAAQDDARAQRFAAERRRDDAVERQARASKEAADWGEKAAFALGKARTDLAERAVARQMDCEADAGSAADEVAAARTEVDRLAALVEELGAERARMSAEIAALDEARTRSGGVGKPSVEHRVEQARARFERLMQDERIGGTQPIDADDEIASLQRADAVAERLAALQAGSAGVVEAAPRVRSRRRSVAD